MGDARSLILASSMLGAALAVGCQTRSLPRQPPAVAPVSGVAPDHAATPSRQTPGAWQVAGNLTVIEIAPGIWVHTTVRKIEGDIDFPANGLLVRRGQGLVMIDTAWGTDATEALLQWIDRELKLPVTQAIVTHFHADSMSGTPALAVRGIPVVAHVLTRELGVDQGVPLPEPLAELPPGGTVSVGGLEVFYPGPAHTRDNIVVWIPEAQVLFGGCAVKATSYGKGNLADAVPSQWAASIARVRARYPSVRVVVPGHGPWGGADLLAHTIGLFQQ